MKKYILILFVLLATAGFAQPIVNTVYADSLKVTKRDGTPAEFILKNATKNILGFLKNVGGGRTEFVTIAAFDSSSLSARIDSKLNKVDTASLSNRINLKLNAADTASLSTRINLKLNAADTASLSTRINLKLNASDTANLSTRINLKSDDNNVVHLSGTETITGNKTISGRTYHSGNTGFGIAFPQNIFSASSLQYSTGTASQSGVTITGSGTSFTASMIGSQFIFANGTSAGYISNVTSTTSLTVSVSQTVSSQSFTINYQGLRGSNNNFSLGSPPSGSIGPFFKVGGFNVSNQFSITGSYLWPTLVAGLDASTNTDGDGSVASYTNSSYAATSGAIRFIRVNPSGSVGNGWQLGELSTYGNYSTSTTLTDRSASIRFYASQTHSSSAAGTYITIYTTPNSTTTMAEAMRIQQSQNISVGTTTDVSNCVFRVANTSKASHPFPNMTLAQRTALTMTSSNYGDMVYQTDGTEGVYVYKSTGWAFAY